MVIASPPPASVALAASAKVVSRAPCVLGAEWSDPTVYPRVIQCAASLRKHVRSIETATSGRQRKEAIRRLLKSPAVKVCAVICAAKDKQVTWAEIDQLSRTLTPWRDCGEAIFLKLVGKSSGGNRPVAAYRLKRRTLIQLCIFAIRAVWGTQTSDYNTSGRGVHAAIEALKSSIDDHCTNWVGVTDVKDCFSSLGQGETAALLPLPKSVVEQTMLIRKGVPILAYKGAHVSSSDRDRLRQGFPQGSPASQIVASRIISDVVDTVGHEGVCRHYADNILFVGHHKGEVQGLYNSLSERFAAHPAGGLTLHHTHVVNLEEEGIDWLGYRVWLDDPQGLWKARARPSKSNTEAFDERLYEALMLAEPSEREDLVISRVLGRINSMKAWSPPDWVIDDEINKRRDWLSGIAAHEAEVLAKHPGLSAPSVHYCPTADTHPVHYPLTDIPWDE